MRPEYVRLTETGIPGIIRKAADIGRHTVIEAVVGDTPVSAIVDGQPPDRGSEVHLTFEPKQTRLYADGWIATEEGQP